MANNFDSNVTRKLAEVFLEKFESTRVLSKNVNTQLLSGVFDPSVGANVDFKRPTDYKVSRTPDGDVSGETKSDIITGKATGTAQDYFTVSVDYNEADEAIKMNQLDKLLAPMATRIVTDLEVDFAAYMLKNAGLYIGTYGTAVSTWTHVARAGAFMESIGIPSDDQWIYAVNPFTMSVLADVQRSLGAGGVAGSDVSDSLRNAVITDNFAGMRVMKAVTLPTVTSAAGADRVGAINGAPDATYVTHKDSMKQTIAVDGMTANLQIKAGQIVQVTGRNYLNLSTKQPIVDNTGSNILYHGVVTADVTLDGTGAGNIVVAGPGIYESGGQYNTIDGALANNDVITVLGAASTLYQPNMFWHKQAFSIGSVPIKKLHSTDTLGTTEDGMQFRVSKGVGFMENKQKVRIDFRPAYATLNPFFAGQGWGV